MNLKIAWLYPELMSTYGDRGNIIALTQLGRESGVNIKIERINLDTKNEVLEKCDLIFMGGAQDLQQEIVNKDLLKNKGEVLKKMIDSNIPGLFICGAYQFLGKYYKSADNKIIEGLSIFDLYTVNPGNEFKRLIGNVIINPINIKSDKYFVGFENHGGRTYLGKNIEPFATLIHGFGNNGEDKYEGAVYKNAIGTYLHGPILPKNYELSYLLLEKSLEIKYKKKIHLKKQNFEFENKAREVIINRYL